jgi:hypothetical protein
VRWRRYCGSRLRGGQSNVGLRTLHIYNALQVLRKAHLCFPLCFRLLRIQSATNTRNNLVNTRNVLTRSRIHERPFYVHGIAWPGSGALNMELHLAVFFGCCAAGASHVLLVHVARASYQAVLPSRFVLHHLLCVLACASATTVAHTLRALCSKLVRLSETLSCAVP